MGVLATSTTISIERINMVELKNKNFDQDWESHSCFVIQDNGYTFYKDVGNIFLPKDWTFWFYHQPGVYDQPEGRDAWKHDDERRVRVGERAYMWFTFNRNHDAGLFQQVNVTLGDTIKFSVYAHAWSNHEDFNLYRCWNCGRGVKIPSGEQYADCWSCNTTLNRDNKLIFPHPHHGEWSEGAGFEAIAWPYGSIEKDGFQQNDAKGNSLFAVGIDPTGGKNPRADTVIWGDAWYIYNGYVKQLTVEATAESETVTVFIRSQTKYAFEHNDAYVDQADIEVVDIATPVTPPRGQPREQYERTYILLPPKADASWAQAVVEGTWDKVRPTFGGSADDAGIGDLDFRRIIAVNPQLWDDDLEPWYEQHYPGIEYVRVIAQTPEDLVDKLKVLFGIVDPPSPPTTEFIRGVHDQAGAEWLYQEGIPGWCCIPVYLGTSAIEYPSLQRFADAGIRVILNLRYSYAVDDGGQGSLPAPDEMSDFIDACVKTIKRNSLAWGFVLANEINNPREWPLDFQLSPDYYLSFYNNVYDHTPIETRISPAGIDPYNPGWGDWRNTWRYVLERLHGAEFVAMHAYTHSPNLAEIWHDKQFSDAPLTGVYYDLRVLESQKAILPAHLEHLPIVVTETNPDASGIYGWPNSSEWIEGALAYFKSQGVAGVTPFRFNHDDWRFGDKPQVLKAIKEFDA